MKYFIDTHDKAKGSFPKETLTETEFFAQFDALEAACPQFGVGAHPHRGHAERVRLLQVARQVLEHGGARCFDGVARKKAPIGLGGRFRLEFGGDDIEHILEMLAHRKARHHRFGVLAGGGCEKEPSARRPWGGGGPRRGLEKSGSSVQPRYSCFGPCPFSFSLGI